MAKTGDWRDTRWYDFCLMWRRIGVHKARLEHWQAAMALAPALASVPPALEMFP